MMVDYIYPIISKIHLRGNAGVFGSVISLQVGKKQPGNQHSKYEKPDKVVKIPGHVINA
jgi:hypothetical protein